LTTQVNYTANNKTNIHTTQHTHT